MVYAKQVADLVNAVVKTIPNIEYCKQVVRSSGSVGANYIEANESLGQKDFRLHIKISRKEAKETRFWLQLMSCEDSQVAMQQKLIQESTELMKIFGAILEKTKDDPN